MRSIEDKEISSSSGINFDFHKGNALSRTPQHHHHHRTPLGKPTPSKWDDAQKWLVNLSRAGGGGGGEKKESSNKPRNSNADDLRLIAPVPKKEDYSSGEEEEKVECNESVWRINKPVTSAAVSAVRSVCVRDMGTEMTPIASQEPSRTATPIRATTPAARSPMSSGSSTPVRFQNGVQSVQTREFTVNSEEPVVDNLTDKKSSNQDAKMNPMETQAMAWDEAERAKYMARYKREEVKIQAWENHEKRKAEMELRRMEVKAERLKARAQEKFTNKLAATRRIAEEKRANAEAKLNEKAVKTSETSDYIRRTGHLPSSFSFKLPSFCW